MPPKPHIVVTEGLESTPFAWLRENATVTEASWKNPAALHTALATGGGAEGLIVRTYTQVNEALLAHAPHLKVVGRAGVGLDNIDQPACLRRNVKVLSTPTANTRAVCEYVFNLLFHLGRPLVHLPAAVPDEAFHAYRKSIRGLELSGLSLGILGMGNIGRGVGKIAHALQMTVLYHDLLNVAPLLDYPAQSVSKEELLSRADVLTIHVNHQPHNLNHHLINAAALAQMKPTAYLINTSRGEVIDAHALAAALKTNKLAAAALDVHDPEPPTSSYPLFGLPNIILAPHLAARTQGAMDRMSWVAKDVVEYLQNL